MYTSVKKTAAVYLSVALFCGIFSYVYERFSHGVYSDFMVYLFLFPLLGGALPHLAILFFRARAPRRLSENLYNSGVATLTVGSCLRGIFEIYGTSSPYVAAYWWAGAALLMLGAGAYLLAPRGMIPQKE